jgi:hypothetical protein
MRTETASPSLLNEQLLGLAQAARRLPPFRQGKPINPSTIFRWITEGVNVPGGLRVRLEAVRLGGRWLTSAEALERFAARQTPTLMDAPQPNPRTAVARRRASEAAARELDRIGIK